GISTKKACIGRDETGAVSASAIYRSHVADVKVSQENTKTPDLEDRNRCVGGREDGAGADAICAVVTQANYMHPVGSAD
ncbi:MAG: hypothetical protein IRA32_20770, partial [Xanthomonas citri pv. citri]